ncbi:Hypothetical protein SMAX5B_005117 [Scophthalmus maximus]|uniref:Uncharacterized protein n=1 Tax=Scophthalmus maximus TaxID=52904 RepID=A0A2U9BUV8_SCOMX|nr:Hypothetical protein SMAX5B_005117 [Scophthalmus maximus]
MGAAALFAQSSLLPVSLHTETRVSGGSSGFDRRASAPTGGVDGPSGSQWGAEGGGAGQEGLSLTLWLGN